MLRKKKKELFVHDLMKLGFNGNWKNVITRGYLSQTMIHQHYFKGLSPHHITTSAWFNKYMTVLFYKDLITN